MATEESNTLLIISVVIAVIAVVTSFVFLYFKGTLGKSVPKRDTIIIAGCSGAGKTQLFAKLVTGKGLDFDTVTSLTAGTGTYTAKSGSNDGSAEIPIIDIPGHGRVRTRYLRKYARSCKGLIFVIDSVSFSKEVSDVAEYMYEVISTLTACYAEVRVFEYHVAFEHVNMVFIFFYC
eukprot:m.170031 g.170031  ORF g.170031 m.170031 type:complete len:177 (-) comp18254_c0_seq2:1073-1603(-)